jgi:hypothetical protein
MQDQKPFLGVRGTQAPERGRYIAKFRFDGRRVVDQLAPDMSDHVRAATD